MPPQDTPSARTRSFEDHPALAQVATTLLTQGKEGPLTLHADDVRAMLPYWRLVSAPRGTALTVAGDHVHTGHLLLLLEGQVGVQTVGSSGTLEVAVLGPGFLIGELALLDGGPRSATCTAVSDVEAAALGRQNLHRLVVEQPAIAARLMVYLCQRVAERLRSVDAQVQAYAQLLAAVANR